jgi:crossover junction endonuclease MUS81
MFVKINSVFFRYMLTQEGKEAACDCLKRSGMAESLDKSASVEIPIHMDKRNSLDMEVDAHDLESEVTPPLNKQNKLLCVPPDSLERV